MLYPWPQGGVAKVEYCWLQDCCQTVPPTFIKANFACHWNPLFTIQNAVCSTSCIGVLGPVWRQFPSKNQGITCFKNPWPTFMSSRAKDYSASLTLTIGHDNVSAGWWQFALISCRISPSHPICFKYFHWKYTVWPAHQVRWNPMRPVSVSIDAIAIPLNQLPPPKNTGYLNVRTVYYIFCMDTTCAKIINEMNYDMV